MRALAAGPLALLGGLLLQCASASADFTTATLLSGTQQLQFGRANAPALSGDGRYAVFQGILADIPGVYRRDLQTGQVQLVSGDDAAAPSVSADGRYVAFTTTTDLNPSEEPAADSGCPEVYVRDMTVTAGAASAYTLASALDGTAEGILFAGPCPGAATGFSATGAQAAPGVAMSADGRHVVFTVLSRSNLGSGGSGTTTDPSQVAVRDLDTKKTTLVSVTPEGQPTPGGGAYPSVASEGRLGERTFELSEEGDELACSTAAISADASTVSWLGTNVPYQVPSATDVSERGISLPGLGLDALAAEAEPLWRRVLDPLAVTRRLLAAAGLDLYFHIGQQSPVLDGSFEGMEEPLFIAPALSAGGRTVAVTANAPIPTAEASWPYVNLRWPNTDAYVIRVPSDPEGSPQVTALTATPTYAAQMGALAAVKDIAISPDGTRVAFDTARVQFDLPALAFTSPPFNNTNSLAQVFEANLSLGTLQRVTSTYNGSEPNGKSGLLSFAGDGQTLAFASDARNLFFGDGVPATEVYIVHEIPAAAQPAPQEVGPTPILSPPGFTWQLSATVTAEADGSVLVSAQVPAAGKLGVDAKAQLPSSSALSPRRAHRGGTSQPGGKAVASSSRSSRTSRPQAPKHSRHGGGHTVALLTVAQAAVAAGGPSVLQVRMRVLARYRSLVSSKHGLYAVVRVSFTAAGHKALVQEIPVTFQVRARRKAPAPKAGKASAPAANGSPARREVAR